jgi:RND family efflux transporter MFP subunit
MRGVLKAAMILLMFGALGCGKKVEQAVQAPPVAVRGVTVSAVAAEPIPEQQEAVGTVKAKNSAVISSRLAGTVTGVFVREGDRVAHGKVIATIDAAESGAAAAGAASGVEEAARALEEARSRRRLGDATFDRYRRLFAEQAVTRQEFEVRQSEQEVAREGVARAEARLKQARETAKAASVVAGYGKVTTPVSGTVVAKQVETGQTVFPGTPLVTVEGDGGYRLEVSVPEGLLGKVKQGDRVGVDLEGAPATGRVSEIVPLVDAASRTFVVKVDLPSQGLRAGRYGKALFRTGAQPGIAIPSAAIVERGALTSVWAVSKDGIARLRLVKVGRKVGDRVEIISGLTAGDRIVTAGADKVSDGVKVE